MERAISEIVGRADMDEGGSSQAYRALRSLLCATCGTGIAEGSLFTRRRVKGIGVRIMPECRECSPFTLQADRKEKSALLRSLLASPTDSARQAKAPERNNSEHASQAQNEEKKKVDEAVRQRLGPALKRGRFRRKF